MLYETPKNILQEKINETLSTGEESIISDLMKLCLLQKAEKDESLLCFTEMYNLLGLEKFTALVSLIDGKTITFPTKEEFKESIILVLCYYYHIMEGRSWKEVKSLLGMPDVNFIKYGIKLNKMKDFITDLIKRRFR